MKFSSFALYICLFLTSFIYGQDLLMQDGTFNQCNGVFFDSGGPASYSNNENYTITICSDSGEDTAIQLDFTFL